MLWFDGHLHEGTCIPFDLSDRGLLLGDGLFDTAMALSGRVAFEDAHISRLEDAAKTLGFDIDRDRVVSAMRTLARAMPRAAIRTTVTRGSGPRGLNPPAPPLPRHWATASPLHDGLAFSSLSATLSSIRRNETSPTATLKTIGYLDAILATREAKLSGFDEPIFLNTRGHVACAGTGNIFVIEDSEILTPCIDDGVLPGIIRAELLRRCSDISDLRIRERSLSASELMTCQTIIMTNSIRLLTPIHRLEERNIPSSSSPIVIQLIKTLREAVAASCGALIDQVR